MLVYLNNDYTLNCCNNHNYLKTGDANTQTIRCQELTILCIIIMVANGPYAKFLNRAHLFLKRGAGDLIFTTCDCHDLNNVVFNFEAHT